MKTRKLEDRDVADAAAMVLARASGATSAAGASRAASSARSVRCPGCGLVLGTLALRCPRCLAPLPLGCAGDCRRCGRGC